MARIRFNSATSLETQASLTVTSTQVTDGNRVVLLNESPIPLKLTVGGTALPTSAGNTIEDRFPSFFGNDGLLKLGANVGIAWTAQTAGTILVDLEVPHTDTAFFNANKDDDQIAVYVGLAPNGNGAIVA